MSRGTHVRSSIALHFEGTISAGEERAMRSHLADCDECGRHYDRLSALYALDPEALDRRTRLGRPLRLVANPKRWTSTLGVVAACAAALIFALPPPEPEPEFQARGGNATVAEPTTEAYRFVGGVSSPLSGTMAEDDELAFTYSNPAGKRFLMVFAVDTAGDVYWYQPTWTDPGATPTAVAIDRSMAPIELNNAVRHDFSEGPIHLISVFTDTPMSVIQMESALEQAGDPRALAISGAHVDVRSVTVTRP